MGVATTALNNVIVFDLESQRLMHDAKDYAWLSLERSRTNQLRLTPCSILGTSRVRFKEKLAPWFSHLPCPVTTVEELVTILSRCDRLNRYDYDNFFPFYPDFGKLDTELNNTGHRRQADRAPSPIGNSFYYAGFDPHWREIDLNLCERKPNKVGSTYMNRRLGLAVGVTWDKKHGYREWWENQANELVNELARYRVIVGANLINFDYCVLERYVPDVRRRLGFRTVDILAHARWGFLLAFLQSRLHRGRKRLSGRNVINIVKRNRLCGIPTFDREDYEFDPEFWLTAPGEIRTSVPRHTVSLQSLARGTLGKEKHDKATNAPRLFAMKKYKELIEYCRRDVELTRDIFLAGCNDGKVRTTHADAPVRWDAIAKQLASVRRTTGPYSEAQCLEFQYQLVSKEPSFFPVEELFRKARKNSAHR
ncbi:MAG: hypothetical protein AAB134_01960 [Pseudomonadota bacterium]